MNFSISKEGLQKALRVVSPAAERRQQQNPVLANVFMELLGDSLQVVATDQEVELTATAPVAKVTMPGRALVPCRKLNDICRVLPEGAEISIDSQGDKTIVKAGRSRFVLSAIACDKFPKASSLHQPQTIALPRAALLHLLDKTSYAMADEDVRYYLNGMLLELGADFLRLVAADGHRLALQTMLFAGADVTPLKVIIPRKAVLEVLRLLREGSADNVSLSFAGSHMMVVCADLSLTTVLLSGKYPDYDKVIPRRGDKIVTSSASALKDAIVRGSALLNEKLKGVRLKFSAGAVQIFAYNAEKDEAEENLAVDYSGTDLEMAFNAKYLLDFLAAATAATITMTLSDANGSALLEEVGDSGGVCVIMPMRV